MTARRLLVSMLVLQQMLIPVSVRAIVARPPETVGAPFVNLRGGCHLRIETLGGTRVGAQVPIPALRLGASVRRGTVSFTTGGSGTANAMEALRRRRAGLQSEPRTFDVAGTAQPEVYAEPTGRSATWLPYQRLPLKTPSPAYDPSVLLFAQATSATTGRIVSIEITMRRPPVATPSLRVVVDARSDRTQCPPVQGLDVYASAMTADHLRRLFAPSGCSWYNPSKCKGADRPRGLVLFVRPQGRGYVHRWIDYDALGRLQIAN
jgi:hypothetical protein